MNHAVSGVSRAASHIRFPKEIQMGLAALHSYLARDFDPAKTHAGQCVDVDPARNMRDFPVEHGTGNTLWVLGNDSRSTPTSYLWVRKPAAEAGLYINGHKFFRLLFTKPNRIESWLQRRI
jgi:hypothetical protein